MTSNPLLFGDAFLYKDTEYIFLVDSGDVWYAARIISKTQTKILCRHYEKAVARNKALVERMPLYCFVELQTKEFMGRAAHLHGSQKDSYSEIPILLDVKITDEDKKSIKEIIVMKNSPTPLQLKRLISKLKLEF